MLLVASDRACNFGLALLRIGIGAMFIIHGVPKLQGGSAVFAKVGGALTDLGVPGPPVLWGALAAGTETIGGLLLVVGFLVRPAAAALLGVMVVAAAMHIRQGHAFAQISHPIETGLACLALALAGGGACALDARFARRAQQKPAA